MISISNIAWDSSIDDEIAEVLRNLGVSSIDVAPGKYFPDVIKTTNIQIHDVRQRWADRGFSIVGIQSLLFGTKGLNVFGDSIIQKMMLNHLQHVCHIGAELNAKKLVFGSPKNRNQAGLSDSKAHEMALEFFTTLGGIAKEEGVIICLETNPICYGANFLTSSMDTFNFVKKLNHSNIKMQLDTGAIFVNQEPFEVVESMHEVIGHIHISEPNLAPLGSSSVNHKGLGEKLKAIKIPKTIEMLTYNEPFSAIAPAVKVVKENYL